MSDEIRDQLRGDDTAEPRKTSTDAEIEDELSPIDPLELLSRAGRLAHRDTAETDKESKAESLAETPEDAGPPQSPAVAKTTAETAEPAEEGFEEAVEENPDEEAESEEFDKLLEEYLDRIRGFSSGDIIDAEIVDVKRSYVLVDIGDKAEGVINIEEFVDSEGELNVAVGDTIPVQILGRDNETGQVRVSHRRALSELAWERVREAVRRNTPVTGRVVQAVRSGLIVDIGIPAFMPASQIDTSRVENLSDWLKREVSAYVIDLDRQRRRAVLSRRKLVKEDEERKRRRILESLEPGQERVVRVKKIMDFGAFADLGGIDGLIPREEISWDRGASPRDYLREGRDLKVRVLSVDRETGRVSLSRKRVKPDPWENIEEKYPIQSVVKGKVVGVANFGAFVSLEEGVRGMIHSSNLSWAGGRKKVEDFLRVGDTVKAVVLEVDKDRRRIALGLKQITMDPWLEVEEKFKPGSVVKGTVTALTNYGAFVRLTEHIEGLIHISDMTWEKKPKAPSHYVKVGDEVEAVVLKTDRDKRRISLGLKQMSKSPFERFVESNPVGSEVSGKVTRLTGFGAFVRLAPEVEGLVHISQLDERRVENPEDVVKVGEEITTKIIKIDAKNQKISLSRKAYLKEQEAKEVAAYLAQSESGGLKMGELLRGLNIQTVDGDGS